MSNMWAKPGVKVVCVDTSGEGEWLGDPLFEGAIYEIERVGRCPVDGEVVFYLVGLTNIYFDVVSGYVPWRFRPLTSPTQEDDVRLIKSLLISNPVDAGLVPAGVEFDT